MSEKRRRKMAFVEFDEFYENVLFALAKLDPGGGAISEETFLFGNDPAGGR